MVAPHFHTTAEAKEAIKKIQHNSMEGGEGAPVGILDGGSGQNQTTLTPAVTETKKGSDWVHKRGIKSSSK